MRPDDDDPNIPIEGQRVRVFSNFIRQAADYLDMTRADYVTLTVVGDVCVSLFTGRQRPRMIAHEALPVEQFDPPQSRVPSKKKAGRKTERKKMAAWGSYSRDPGEVMAIFQSKPKEEFPALAIGDALEMPRKDPGRQSISRMLAELRLSGFINATSEGRVPSYIFAEALPKIKQNGSGTDITEKMILDLLKDRPLAFAVVADLLGIDRMDSIGRRNVSHLLRLMAHRGSVRRKETENKLAVYSLP